MPTDLLQNRMSVINVGVKDFGQSVADSNADLMQIDWRPVGGGDVDIAWMLAELEGDKSDPSTLGSRIDAANITAIARLLSAQPVLEDVALHASEVWPDMGRTLLHAGAPVDWNSMCGPMQGAAIGAVLYEGWADSVESATELLATGSVKFSTCHENAAVGPMAGIISPSMPVFVVRNTTHHNYAYSNMNEGIGKVLRFGANSQEVVDRLRWIETVLAPGLKAAVNAINDGIALKTIQSQALLMGDEVHSRNTAATLIFFSTIAAPLLASSITDSAKEEIVRFLASNSQFFLNLSMASAKATMDAVHGIPSSSIVTAIARNGVTTAIRVSGLNGQWFEHPSDMPAGLYFPGFGQEHANPDLGDSAITETAGFGGFSLAASPALVQLVGGSVAEAVMISKEMYQITSDKNPAMSIPMLDFAGSPAGIDIRKVIDTGIRPVLTTGIAHKSAGVGQIGAGLVRVPMECFAKAARALATKCGIDS